MPTVKIQNLTHPFKIPLQAGYCTSFLCQLRGLTFRRSLPPHWGLLLVQKRESRMDAAIHMFMMWIDLAVIWINAQNKVVDVRPAYRWKSVIVPQAPAKYVLELPLKKLNDFQIGDEIEIRAVH
ncbi:MAG TPA: DUF192 domain-containing protein [Anaerolineales bacterium]|nr:DUF192 domain-containing protein [Anaerolineales bacterium]